MWWPIYARKSCIQKSVMIIYPKLSLEAEVHGALWESIDRHQGRQHDYQHDFHQHYLQTTANMTQKIPARKFGYYEPIESWTCTSSEAKCWLRRLVSSSPTHLARLNFYKHTQFTERQYWHYHGRSQCQPGWVPAEAYIQYKPTKVHLYLYSELGQMCV